MATNPARRMNVSQMGDNERRTVEHLLGRPLEENQQLYILAFKPGVVPDEATRRRALESMQQTFAKSERHAGQEGVTEAEIDKAVDEAVDHIRYRKS